MSDRGKHEADLYALSNVIYHVCGLRGIGVSAVYVDADLMAFIRGETWESCVECDRAGVKVEKTRNGSERVTIQPYGTLKPIPVKEKYSGKSSWKAVICYKSKEEL